MDENNKQNIVIIVALFSLIISVISVLSVFHVFDPKIEVKRLCFDCNFDLKEQNATIEIKNIGFGVVRVKVSSWCDGIECDAIGNYGFNEFHTSGNGTKYNPYQFINDSIEPGKIFSIRMIIHPYQVEKKLYPSEYTFHFKIECLTNDCLLNDDEIVYLFKMENNTYHSIESNWL